jgi:hypothetical protein
MLRRMLGLRDAGTGDQSVTASQAAKSLPSTAAAFVVLRSRLPPNRPRRCERKSQYTQKGPVENRVVQ